MREQRTRDKDGARVLVVDTAELAADAVLRAKLVVDQVPPTGASPHIHVQPDGKRVLVTADVRLVDEPEGVRAIHTDDLDKEFRK